MKAKLFAFGLVLCVMIVIAGALYSVYRVATLERAAMAMFDDAFAAVESAYEAASLPYGAQWFDSGKYPPPLDTLIVGVWVDERSKLATLEAAVGKWSGQVFRRMDDGLGAFAIHTDAPMVWTWAPGLVR
jgi:hypothetical protein